MKRYIATSSLNLDNITTSESISPFSFYANRKYGYNSFEKVSDHTDENNVVLFPDIPFFDIQDSDRENYPMIIELDDDKQLGLSDDDKSIVKYGNTIIINPFNCRFLFFTDNARIMSKLKCDDSKCNKLGEYFQLETIAKERAKRFEKTDSFIEKSGSVDDNQINTQKGFVYGYCMGLLRSLSPNSAKLLSIQKEIYNFVVAIINNKGENTQLYKDKVCELDEQFKNLDPNVKKLSDLWAEKFNPTATEELKSLGLEVEAKTRFAKKHNIPFRSIRFTEKSDYRFSWEAYKSELDSFVSTLLYNERRKLSDIDVESVFGTNSYLSVSEKEEYDKLYNHILSKFFANGSCTVDTLRLNRVDFAKTLLSDIFEFTGEKQEYFKYLMFNIAKSEPFDILSTDNVVFQSIASFLLKGEEFDSLITFMQEKGISEYKYALGFWGAMTGYADISKNIAKPILVNTGFGKFYKNFYKFMFDVDLEGNLVKYVPPVRTYYKPEIIQEQAIQNYPIIDKLQFILVTDVFRKQKVAIQNEIQMQLSAIKDDEHIYENVLSVQKPFGRQGLKKAEWEKCISRLNPIKGKKKEKGFFSDVVDGVRNLFTSNDPEENSDEVAKKELGQYFYCDKNVWPYIEEILEPSIRKDVKKDLGWFQNDIFSKPQGSRGYDVWNNIDEKNNKTVIDKFCSLKMGSYPMDYKYPDKAGKVKAPYYTDAIRDSIKQLLYKLYNVNTQQ